MIDPIITPTYRYVYFSSVQPSSIHTKSLIELAPTIIDNLDHKQCFWIDIQDPTPTEMKQLQDIFYIHPLTTEDITTEEPREKCEAFNHYYFICFKTFDADPYSPTYLQPIGIYILLFKDFVLTVSLTKRVIYQIISY